MGICICAGCGVLVCGMCSVCAYVWYVCVHVCNVWCMWYVQMCVISRVCVCVCSLYVIGTYVMCVYICGIRKGHVCWVCAWVWYAYVYTYLVHVVCAHVWCTVYVCVVCT